MKQAKRKKLTPKQIKKAEEQETEWLNSKGHSSVKVKCAGCKKEFETVIENVRKDYALKHDTFYCSETCGDEEIIRMNVKRYYLLARKIIRSGMLSHYDASHIVLMFADVTSTYRPHNNEKYVENLYHKLLCLIDEKYWEENKPYMFNRQGSEKMTPKQPDIEKQRIQQDWEKIGQKAIKKCSCKKCGGVIVRSYVTSLMAMTPGRRCDCKKK